MMRLVVEACVQALEAARSHVLRSSLAALATAAAVATIVVVVGAIDGISRFARETSARAFGSNTFVIAQVATGQLSRRELADRLAKNPPLKRADARFLDRMAADAVLYAPTAQRSSEVVAGNLRFEGASVNGTTDRLPDIRVIDVGDGRFFSESESTRGAQVAVIGADVADTLFPGRRALGERVRIAGRAFDVVGVVLRQGQAGGVSLDRYVYIPLVAYERTFGSPPSLQVFARPADADEGLGAEGVAYASMRARRQLAPGAPDTFDIITPQAARNFVLQVAQRIGAAAFPISAMALLTAVVVVANTVLVSVTQRTREIGIRRAVGAPRGQILAEVLAESILTAIGGGLAGLLVAWLVLTGVSRLLDFGLPVALSTVGWAFAAAAFTGVAAGFFPARKAARLDVVTALRTE